MTWILAARAFLSRVPWQIWLIAAALVSAWLWGNHRYSQGVHTERARWEAIAAKAQAKSHTAGEAGIAKADNTKTEIEEGNTRAKEAARNSADPLRDGLNSLR